MLLRMSFLVSMLTLLLNTGGSSAAIVSPLSELSWMAGCWQMQQGTRLIEEQWMAPRGQLMLGMSRTSVAEQVRAYEHMLIREEAEALVFQALPSGQAATEFRLLEQTANSVAFANPAHDFPQRIRYRSAAGGDSLLVQIEGELRGEARVIEFPYERVACPN